jgi:chemotaxis protein MotB
VRSMEESRSERHERKRRRSKKWFGREQVIHQDDGEGNWLISYADMMTLLMGFFVVVTAFSTPDSAKLERLKQETSKSMGVDYENPFEDLSKNIHEVLQDLKLGREVEVRQLDDGIELVSNGTLFFDSGSTELKPLAAQLMGEVARVIVEKARGFRVVVEGHTDDNPITSKQFPSNWELSSNRASTVVRLLEDKGFSRVNLSPIGLADTKPLVPNRLPSGAALAENQARNRRIVIRILKNLQARAAGVR